MSTDNIGYTQMIGLWVRDQAGYAEYRANMTPILHRYGGEFGTDLEVSRVLKPAGEELNRIFTIGFPSRAVRDAFFADPAYLAVRAQHFEPAVSRVTRLGEWET